ncbi:MAG: polymer-forming cytoskeletal protein [Actinomycetota bacterium]
MTIFKRDEVEDVRLPAGETGESQAEQRGAAERPSRREVRRMEQSGEVTVIGGGAKLEGTIVSAGSLRVDGQVKGQIQADGDVMLSSGSRVEADVTAASVSVAGSLRGTVTVTGRAELKSGGRVEGNISSASLVVEEGAIFDGQSTMQRKGQPTPGERSSGEHRKEVSVP